MKERLDPEYADCLDSFEPIYKGERLEAYRHAPLIDHDNEPYDLYADRSKDLQIIVQEEE